jgi:hypothetical protein
VASLSRPITYFDFVRDFCTVLDARQRRAVPLKLYPLQEQFVRDVLERRDPETGYRVIRRGLWSAPKKTGKSAFVASLACYELIFGREMSREINLIAWDYDQTEYLFDAAAGFLQRNPTLRAAVTVGKKEITYRDRYGKHVFRRLAREDRGAHGSNPSMVIVDEAWSQPDWSMLEALAFSPLRAEPLILFTSYAGYEQDMVPGRPLYDLWLKLQPNAAPDPSFHGVWMTGQEARQQVPWWSEAWIEEQARLLEREPGAFRRLVENEWAQSAQGLFTPQQVAAMVDHTLTPTGGRTVQRTAFVDIGWSRDHTAVVTVHREPDGTVICDDVFHLVGTKDAPIQYPQVEAAILDLHRRFNLRVVADQWGARQMIQRLKALNVRIKETTVTASYHDRIARTLIDLEGNGLLRIFPHEALIKQLGSVVLKRALGASRDDSSAKVKIDSGAGAGVAGKDDLVVALAAAAFEASRGGAAVATIRTDYGKSAPSAYLQQMRAAKTAQRLRELAPQLEREQAQQERDRERWGDHGPRPVHHRVGLPHY